MDRSSLHRSLPRGRWAPVRANDRGPLLASSGGCMLTVRRVPLGSLALVVVLLAAGSAWAQVTGTVSGTVADSQGQPVPGATVTLTNDASRDPRTLTSQPGGALTFRPVPHGPYTALGQLS